MFYLFISFLKFVSTQQKCVAECSALCFWSRIAMLALHNSGQTHIIDNIVRCAVARDISQVFYGNASSRKIKTSRESYIPAKNYREVFFLIKISLLIFYNILYSM